MKIKFAVFHGEWQDDWSEFSREEELSAVPREGELLFFHDADTAFWVKSVSWEFQKGETFVQIMLVPDE